MPGEPNDISRCCTAREQNREQGHVGAAVTLWLLSAPRSYRRFARGVLNFLEVYLLGATGICVVPASSFCSRLHGFRITALEEDPDLMQNTIRRLAKAIRSYLASGARELDREIG